MFKKSLGTKIVALYLLVGLLPLLLLAGLFSFQMRISLTKTISNSLITLVSEVGIEVERTIFTAYSNIKTLADNHIISSKETTREEKLLEMQKIQDFYKVFEDVTLIDLAGNVITSTTYNYRGAWKAKNWYKQAVEGNAVVSNVHILQSPYKIVMVTTSPVVDRDGKIMAVIAGQINMEKIWEITDRVKVNKTGFVFLLDKKGNIIAFPDKRKILLRLTPDVLLEQILAKPSGTVEYKIGEFKKQVCGFVTLEGYLDYKGKGWKIGIIQDSREVYVLSEMVQGIMFVAAGGLFIIIIFASIFLTFYIVKPLRALAVATKRVAEGDLTYPVEVTSEDEIGNLGRAFNSMIVDLKKSRDEIENYSRTLELKVKERTEELSQANEDLKEINQELDDFSYIVSHDLKEPLRVISAFSSFVYEDYKDKLLPAAVGYLQKIKINVCHMEDLINDLLEVSRISRRKNPFEEVDLNVLFGEIKERFAYAFREKNVEFIVNKLPRIFCDRVRIKEVFVNLISNALKFTDKPCPKIEIGLTQPSGEFHCFYVKDNGIGIEKQYFDKIFQIFQRLHSRDKYEGTGAGLAICKKIIEQHYGKIWIESEPGKGTIFYFTLPNVRANIIKNSHCFCKPQ